MERPPLPPGDGEGPLSIPQPRIYSSQSRRPPVGQAEPALPAKKSGPPHILVKRTYDAFAKIDPDETDRLRAFENALDVYVGYRALDRAMDFIDFLIKDLESRGHSVCTRANSPRDRWVTYAVIDDEHVPFHIEESTQKKRVIDQHSDWRSKRFETVLSGEIKLFIDQYFGQSRRPSWSDSKTFPLEYRISEIWAGFKEAANKIKINRLEDERRKEEFRKAEERRLKIEAEERLKREQIAQLEPCSVAWEKANRIRSFLSALEAAAIRKYGELDGELTAAIARGREHADSIDPVIQSLEALDQKP